MGMGENDSTNLVNDFNSLACPPTVNCHAIRMWSLSFGDVWSGGRVSCVGEGLLNNPLRTRFTFQLDRMADFSVPMHGRGLGVAMISVSHGSREVVPNPHGSFCGLKRHLKVSAAPPRPLRS